jgi:hypothetical protein
MVTAIMTGPQGEKLTPRYQAMIFDTLAECQQALSYEPFARLMVESVSLAYPDYLLDQVGCGAWDMDHRGDQPFADLPKEFY